MIHSVVVGGGIMGSGIAIALARAGHAVSVVEPNECARARLNTGFAEHRWPSPELVPSVGADLQASAAADLVIEAAPEHAELKRALWRRIGTVAPETAILATNTSSLDVDDLAACVPNPARVLATHWFNPAYEIPCVEVAPGHLTSSAVVQHVMEILAAAGKRPVVVGNTAGFVANRIQFAAIREAMLCVQEGASPADVDEIVRSSFAPRLAALGPLANADLGGLDTYLAIFDVLRRAHGARFEAPAMLVDLVAEGRVGTKANAGVFDYTPQSARALAMLRDDRISRVLGAIRNEQGT
ncbi:3-hydroxybutyryl-CoA dehydrogenase [Microbacterium sp. AK009]|uniref:3-hydroxyacyl-CoA dehydrogenase family protein n=1 Tax=Microbacterium sp. AK009 TaxID=2723068 RepID=UPI0015CCE18E|nr:3-hydroxyacyl-CoA dehydrogenase family protein [Microbacterium sp. AK009]NYF16638.1 3-hydroxybutyryl-CoA dehydrogenase [Microbacterium sp. AK009]